MKTRVLHILPDLMPYGLEKMVASLVLLTDRRRFQPAVVSLYGRMEGSLASTIEAAGIPVMHLNKSRGLDLRMFPRLRKAYADFRPHVVHTHNYVLRYTWPVSSVMRPCAQVHTIHNVAEQEVDRLGMWLQNRAFRGAVTPVAIAKEVASSMGRVYGLNEPVTIPNGIPVRDFDTKPGVREAWRLKQGFAQDDLLIACVARFFPQKNHKALIEAFAKVAATGAKLLLAGDGYLEADIRVQVQRLGLAKQVFFLGRRDDIPSILDAVDVVALASLWEGNPLSVMEAMAAGKPCAMTTVGAIPELMDDNRSGILCAPGDAGQMAEALARLIDSPHLRSRLGYAARERALARFDHAVMTRAYEDLYTRLMHATNRQLEGANA
jgi:glycosyltransferase involved in cell wall biosynthesis